MPSSRAVRKYGHTRASGFACSQIDGCSNLRLKDERFVRPSNLKSLMTFQYLVPYFCAATMLMKNFSLVKLKNSSV